MADRKEKQNMGSLSRQEYREDFYEHMNYHLQKEDEDEHNHTVGLEQELLEAVRCGDVEKARSNLDHQRFPKYPELLNAYEKKMEEYMAVITVALCARTVTQAGISSVESFRMSDVYLKRIALSRDVGDIFHIRNQAILTYTELVSRRKKNRKNSAYVEEVYKSI